MKLRDISLYALLAEGFRMDTTGLDPQTVTQLSKVRGTKGTLKQTLRGQKFYYEPQDSPGDIVQVQLVMQEKKLAEFVDTHHLPTFDGKILYAFATSEVESKTGGPEYRDPVISQMIDVMERARAAGFANLSVNDLYAQDRLLQNPHRYGISYAIPPDIQARDDEKRNLIRLILLVIQQLNAADAKAKITSANKARQYLLAGVGHKYTSGVAYTFAEVMKHPANPEEEQLQIQFMKMCEEIAYDWAVANNPEGYHFIVYPKSSSNFNAILAVRLAEVLNPPNEKCEALQINKLQVKDTTINWDQMYERALRMAPHHYDKQTRTYVRRLKSEYREFDTPEEFARDWANEEKKKLELELGKLNPTDEAEIKRLDYLDKRRYVKMFDPSGTERAANKRVLIIDDNVVGGGTVELVYEVLRRVQPPPQRIDAIVPLRIMSQ